MAKLCPLFARVLLERPRLKKVGSIHIPEGLAQTRNAPLKGVVIAKGPTADDSIKVGGTYIFGQHAGAWINSEGKPAADPGEEHYYICADEDLICEVRDE